MKKIHSIFQILIIAQPPSNKIAWRFVLLSNSKLSLLLKTVWDILIPYPERYEKNNALYSVYFMIIFRSTGSAGRAAYLQSKKMIIFEMNGIPFAWVILCWNLLIIYFTVWEIQNISAILLLALPWTSSTDRIIAYTVVNNNWLVISAFGNHWRVDNGAVGKNITFGAESRGFDPHGELSIFSSKAVIMWPLIRCH